MIGVGSNLTMQNPGLSKRTTHFGFLFLVVVLLFPYRMEYGWGFFSTLSVLDIALVLMFPVVLGGILARGRLTVADRAVFFVLLMPVIFALISLAWTINLSATLKSIVVYGSAAAALLVTVELCRRCSFGQVSLVFVVVPFLLIGSAILSYVPGSPLRPELIVPEAQLSQEGFLVSYHARLSHPFLGLSNSFATILAMLLPMVLFARQAGFRPRLSWWAAIFLFAAILATGSRGVLLAVVMVYAMIFALKSLLSGRLPTRGLVFVFVALGLAILFLLLNPDAQKHLAGRLSVDNIASRLDAFYAVFDVLYYFPWGIGSGVGLNDVYSGELRSVHNAYLQNFLWFGWFGGLMMSMLLLALPILVLLIPVRSSVGRQARRAVALSISILLLVNLSQASWEGSLLRVWIYFVIGLGLVMIQQADRYGVEKSRE